MARQHHEGETDGWVSDECCSRDSCSSASRSADCWQAVGIKHMLRPGCFVTHGCYFQSYPTVSPLTSVFCPLSSGRAVFIWMRAWVWPPRYFRAAETQSWDNKQDSGDKRSTDRNSSDLLKKSLNLQLDLQDISLSQKLSEVPVGEQNVCFSSQDLLSLIIRY